MHKSQIFFFILLSFILGVFAGSFFSISKNTALVAAIICALLIAVFYRRDSRLLNPRLALAAFLTLFFLAGILRFNSVDSQTHNLQKFVEAQENVIDPQNKHPIRVTLYGYLSSEPETSGDKQRLVFFAKQLQAGSYVIDLKEKVMLTTQMYPQYKYGDELKVYGQIKKPENFSEFDYAAYLAKEGVFTTMFYPEIEPVGLKISFIEGVKVGLFKKVFALKGAFENSISRSVSEPNAAFINGILLGSRSQIPDTLQDAFARTGTTHILAISGYNITIIAVIVSWLFLLFFRRPTAFWFSVAAVVLFTILTGAQASVVRAAIMATIVLLARREGRLSDPRNAIVLAGAAMILFNPIILRHDVGFQLSFMATLGLIYVSPVIERYFQKMPNFFELRETMIMTVSAQIFVLPLLIYYFKNISLVSVPVNLLILPLVPVSMIFGFITGLAGLAVPFLGQSLGYFAWLITSVQIGIINIFAKPVWASVTFGIGWPGVIIFYALLILLLVRLGKTTIDKRSDERIL